MSPLLPRGRQLVPRCRPPGLFKDSNIIISFEGVSIPCLKAAFRFCGINLTSGNNSTKGIISKQDFALINFFNTCWNPKVTYDLINLISNNVLSKKAVHSKMLKYNNLTDF